jgi:ABC-type nitrate/sulfonate/bicarbonate transport system ATPase subunit
MAAVSRHEAGPTSQDAAAQPLIAFEDVHLSLGGRLILAGITVAIRKGDFLSVVGPSGCGKTSLLNLAAGFLAPSKGRITYNGRPIAGPRPDIAIVFQDYGKALLPWRTTSGNIALALEAISYPRQKRPARIAELLALVGLTEHAEKYPSQLSGGMQQRLQIARCLAQDPAVLLMDEPFGALDALTRQALQDEVLAIAARTGATVLFITHDLEEAIYLGDRVIAMRRGPGRFEASFTIDLPRPRDQLTTRERPEFLKLRRGLFDVIREVEP